MDVCVRLKPDGMRSFLRRSSEFKGGSRRRRGAGHIVRPEAIPANNGSLPRSETLNTTEVGR